MRYNPHAVERALGVLRHVATLDVVRAFLESHGLAHSAASWDEMIRDRLRPYLQRRELTMKDLFELLRESEEYGHQHVFLYRCSATQARDLMNIRRIRTVLRRLDQEQILSTPQVLEGAGQLTLVDVRLDSIGPGRSIVVKAVETRTYLHPQPIVDHGSYVVRRWDKEEVRAVSVAELGQDGSLQLRIYQHKNATKYERDLNKFWALIDPILPQARFSEVSLGKLKNRLAGGTAKFAGTVGRNQFITRNSQGSTQTLSTGPEDQDLFEDEGAVAGISGFMKHNNAFCEGTVVRFARVDGVAVPSRTIHVRVSGLANEFSIGSNCTKQDHRYVLDQLRRAGR